ncbi:MAG: TolC family protein [Bacteroidales bacterium]
MKKFILNLSLIVLIFPITYAQNALTEQDAISIALKYNYDILVARNNASTDSVNNTPGNAGMLPNISINASESYSAANNIQQKFSDGTSLNSSNVNSNSLNASVGLNWTLFDGGKMFVTKRKLNEIQALGEIQFRDGVLQTVYDVILAYYDVVRQKQELASINEVITYNLERVKISQTSYDAGLSPKTNLLQAKIDLNVYQENAINQQSIIIAAKRTLNKLLGRNPDISFEVLDSIPINDLLDKQELAKKLDASNTSILAYKKQVDISKLSLKEMNTLLFPRISFNTGYGLFQSNTPGSIPLTSRTIGPSIGGTISIPVFQAGNAGRQIKIAKIQLQSDEYNLESIRLQMNQQLQNALTQFENHLQLLRIEKDNAILAKENLEISIQRLRFGQTTSLEVSLAEGSFVESLTRLINFEYDLKVAETKLKQLLSRL